MTATGQFGEWVAPQHDGRAIPTTGHDVLIFPMKQVGQQATKRTQLISVLNDTDHASARAIDI